jgi:hypothetical protein
MVTDVLARPQRVGPHRPVAESQSERPETGEPHRPRAAGAAVWVGCRWSAQQGEEVLARRPSGDGQGVAGQDGADRAAGLAVGRRAAGAVRPARQRGRRSVLPTGARDRHRADGLGFLGGLTDRFRLRAPTRDTVLVRGHRPDAGRTGRTRPCASTRADLRERIGDAAGGYQASARGVRAPSACDPGKRAVGAPCPTVRAGGAPSRLRVSVPVMTPHPRASLSLRRVRRVHATPHPRV